MSYLDNYPIKLKNKEMHKMFIPKQIYGYIFVYDATSPKGDDATYLQVKIKLLFKLENKKIFY